MITLLTTVSVVITSLLPTPQPVSGAAAPAAARLVAQAAESKPLDMKVIKIRFGFNDDKLDVQYRDQLAAAARCLKSQEKLQLVLMGHADERGTAEYNLALGERRALTVKNYLEGLGVPGARLRVVSYGEERPEVGGHDEDSWASNRRVEFSSEGNMQPGRPGCPDEGASADSSTGTKQVDDDEEARKRREQEEEEARRRKAEEDEARRRAAEAAKNKPAESTGSKRMFPWLPIWVGPLVMALAVPPLLLAAPFLLTVVYLGPQVWAGPNGCEEPLIMQNGSPNTGSTNPLKMCGTGWSAAQHEEHRPLSVPGAVVGVGGFLVLAGSAVVTFGAGVVLLVMALLPASETQDAQAAAAPR
ncbi:MAG: OmpA family protein [Deltaproteobacteria bacterium]|nr:OmpA family protein [Deltaproteobacteria bacterium]